MADLESNAICSLIFNKKDYMVKGFWLEPTPMPGLPERQEESKELHFRDTSNRTMKDKCLGVTSREGNWLNSPEQYSLQEKSILLKILFGALLTLYIYVFVCVSIYTHIFIYTHIYTHIQGTGSFHREVYRKLIPYLPNLGCRKLHEVRGYFFPDGMTCGIPPTSWCKVFQKAFWSSWGWIAA